MYNHTLHSRKKHFCRYYLQAFSVEEILKHHVKDCFKMNDQQNIIMPKKDEYARFKNYERKTKSPLIIMWLIFIANVFKIPVMTNYTFFLFI